MNNTEIKENEKNMRRLNAKSVADKLIVGSLAIIAIGICAFAFLFILMLLI